MLGTLELTGVSMALAIALGFILAALGASANPVLIWFVRGYVWIFRSVPLIIQLLIWYNLALLFPVLAVGVPFTSWHVQSATNTVVTHLPLLNPRSVPMAVNIYLSIPGLTDEKGAPRPGTVLIDSIPYLQISDFSFSVANTGVASTGAAAGKVELEFNPLTVVLPVDFVTPLLLQACAEGTQFASASLIVQAGGTSPLVITQKYDFKTVVLRSLSLEGSTSGDQQTLTFGYGALQITYTPLDAQGKAQTPSTGGFDITTNKAT